MRYLQLMLPVSGRQTLWLLLAFFLTLGIEQNIAVAAAPGNDNFSAATEIPNTEKTGTIGGNTIEATAEDGEPVHYFNPAHHSIWYKWTAPSAPSAAPISFDTQGSSFDTVLAIYTGSSVANLSLLVNNDDNGLLLTSKVSFIPTPDTTYYIAVDGFDEFDADGGSGSTVLNWAIITHTLTITPAGTGTGTVTSNPIGIDCGADCEEVYDVNTLINLTATADPDSTFVGWSGDADCSDGSVTMDADKNCTATFTLNTINTRILTIIKTGAGTVTSSPGGITCGDDCLEVYDVDAPIALTATPDANNTFTGWSGDADCSDGSVTMDVDKTCTATFTLNTHTLEITTAGAGSGTTEGEGTYPYGTIQEITATADLGSTFVGWSGDADCSDGSVTIDDDKTCTATFTLNPYTLTVNKTGAGTVTSNPGGIACGADCSEVYDVASQITLTATPDANNTFVGWSGGNCTGTQNCTVTIIDADITISAIFKKNFPWPMFLPAITKRVE